MTVPTLRPARSSADVLLPDAPLATTAPEEATLGNRRGQTLLGGFTAAHFSHHVSTSLLNPLLPFIRDAFVLTYGEAGFLVSAFSLSLGVSNAPIGLLADRIGSRPVIVAGLVLLGLASVAVGLAGSYWQLFLLLMVMGLIAGSYHAPANALLARAFPARVRGAAIGLHITGGHLSYFIAPLVAALMVSATGTWRTPYIWLAFAPILTGVMVWYLAPREHERPKASPDRLAVFRELGSVVRTIGPLVSISMLFQMFYAALLAMTTLYLVDARGLPAGYAAIIFGVPQLIGVLGAPLGGILSDRFGRRAVILVGVGMIGPSLYAFTLVPNELILVPLCLIGIGTALRMTVTEVFVTDSAPPHRRATVLGAYYMLGQPLGGILAPLLGLISSVVGIGAAFSGTTLGLAFISIAVVLLRRRL